MWKVMALWEDESRKEQTVDSEAQALALKDKFMIDGATFAEYFPIPQAPLDSKER